MSLFDVTDSLVQYLQFVHDGDLPGGPCVHDIDAHSKKGLCTLLQRRGNG